MLFRSRQIGSLPPMVGGMSISSSPGKPISPHTPHTPAIPSRLSNNSIAEYSPRIRPHAVTAAAGVTTGEERENDDEETNAGAAPMNIPLPTSPRLYQYGSHNRRSSSVAQQQRILAGADDSVDGPYRSMSVGAEDREPPSLTDLRGFGQTSGSLRVLQPAAEITGAPSSMPRASPAMQRLGASNRGGLGPRTGSSSSVATGSGSERERANRYSFQRTPAQAQGAEDPEDEYPMLFDMSELGRNSEQGRRSLEEGRGGGDSGSSVRRGGRWLGN